MVWRPAALMYDFYCLSQLLMENGGVVIKNRPRPLVWCRSRCQASTASLLRLLDRTQLVTYTWYNSFYVISLSQRLLPTQHTTNTRDEHPCLQQDSNPQSSEQLQTYALDCMSTQFIMY
jgi:hypothetical protein